MLKKEHIIPFLLGWLVLGFILPPSRILGGLGGKKTA